MVSIKKIAKLISGTPQFRITEDGGDAAPTYVFYAQTDLEEDLRGLGSSDGARKQVKTFDKVKTAVKGDVVFSLLSGTATIVREEHQGYLLTQNYVVLKPSDEIDARYLVYLLNENRQVRHQLYMGQQGSATMKYTLSQLNDLKLPLFPPRARQELIGDLYFNQLRLEALRKRASESETTLVLGTIGKTEQS